MNRAGLPSLAVAMAIICSSRHVMLAAPVMPLRVCADPNNLPFSDRAETGFENELAKMIGRDLHVPVQFIWWAQRRGALRNTLKANLCDVLMGVPTTLQSVSVTNSYYRSSYVFVSRSARALDVESFDDPRLKTLTIGVQVVGDDYANTPPVHALSARGIAENVRGYSVVGDYANEAPPARILEAVQSGEIDIAIVWGPLAGYFAQRDHRHWRLTPTPEMDGALPMRFDIGIGLRPQDRGRSRQLDQFLARRKPRIDALLARFGVPRL